MKLIEDLGSTKIGNSYRRFGLYLCPVCNITVKMRTDSVRSNKPKRCRNCANKEASNISTEASRKKAAEAFIDKAIAVHGKDRYDYSNVVYTTAKNKVEILCNSCGTAFAQCPDKHLSKRGCPKCKLNNIGWTDSKWEQQAQCSHDFIAFCVYVVLCKSDNELFIKVGKTFRTPEERFRDPSIPYEITVLHHKEFDSSKDAGTYERKCHTELKEFSYTPVMHFKGFTECFTTDALTYFNLDLNHLP